MAHPDRTGGRDVFFYDLRDVHTQLGGLGLTNGITKANFYAMIEIVLIIHSEYVIQNDNGEAIERNAEPLLPGNYFIVADGSVEVSDKIVLLRTQSLDVGTRVRRFTQEVRERDGRCVVTKMVNVNASLGKWRGFEAAHIFPLAYQQHWNENNYARWVTIPAETGGPINSVQNGILLRADIHTLFDHFDFSINPDDDYKVVCFAGDSVGIAGTFLDRTLLDDERRPVDELLRWHFRQAVLANMRGAGVPVFEHDFPPGSDIMEDIMNGPMAPERMEFELFSRLAVQMELQPESEAGSTES